jgi:acetylornithine deacetylase/succinyl-diaminopimelate desuccinylase-like protein
MSLQRALEWLRENRQSSIDRLVDWLRIPSISTDPAYREPTARAAAWCADVLRECGFEVEVVPTGSPESPGHPVVLAHAEGEASYRGPHVLFYGHYDVQPVDPLDEWESPPFEPVVRDARPGEEGGPRVVARGAVDDKGQVMTFLEAMRAWKAATGKPAGGARFTVLIEGEEECGSVHLDDFLMRHKARLKPCDVCLISDTGMLGRDRPAITYGVRGLAYTEVVLHGADRDLHSGLWGGRCPNPITELCRVLGQLHDRRRRVTIPGFYDDVVPLSARERAAWRALKFDARAALRKIGLPPSADVGEAGYTALEREWGRPTAEINGIVGGYTGQGAKTVIPSQARAKVSFRLVANQDPKKITRLFFGWCRERTPPGCRWELIDHHGGLGVTTPIDSPEMGAARRALESASGRTVSLIRSGGSIPVAGSLKRRLGIDTIFMGFGLDDDRVHSPNEKFELACFDLGARSHAHFVGQVLSMSGRRG